MLQKKRLLLQVHHFRTKYPNLGESTFHSLNIKENHEVKIHIKRGDCTAATSIPNEKCGRPLTCGVAWITNWQTLG